MILFRFAASAAAVGALLLCRLSDRSLGRRRDGEWPAGATIPKSIAPTSRNSRRGPKATMRRRFNCAGSKWLRSLIDNEIMLQRAEKEGLVATDADVDARLTELRAPYTKEGFEKQLKAWGLTMRSTRAGIRRDESVKKLFNKDITSKINITDADVANFYNSNRGSFNLAEPQVHMAQILVTPKPDPNIHNLKNDKARNDDEAKRKIDAIEARLRQGEDFGMMAQNYSEDAATQPNGGDLGFLPESSLDKTSPELRNMVLSMTPGQMSDLIHTPDGYRILKMISSEPAGQRDLSDPRVQQSIRETLLQREDQLLKTAYYEIARNEAKVVNYMARSVFAEAPGGQK